MTTNTLLGKLRDAEGALNRADYAAARWTLLEAEEMALPLQREMIDMQARLPASVAPSYRTVATGIKERDIVASKRTLIALRRRVGRFAELISRHRHL